MSIPPCLVNECKNPGWCCIFIEEKKIRKGFDAPGAKGYTLCRKHVAFLKKVGQITVKDY